MSAIDDILPDVGLSPEMPQSASLRVSGNTSNYTAADRQSFGINFDGTYLSLGDIPDVPGPSHALVLRLTPPLLRGHRSQVIPSVPSFSELDSSLRDFKGFVARLLVVVVNYIIQRLGFTTDSITEMIWAWPNHKEHFYAFVAAHLQFAMSALRQLGLPCSLPMFTSILDGYIQGVMTGRNHENTFEQVYNQYARRLCTPLLTMPTGAHGAQVMRNARLEVQGAIEILSCPPTRRALTDGHPSNGYTLIHRLGFEDTIGIQAFTYRLNRYWLSDAELNGLPVLDPEPQLLAPNIQPLRRLPNELLRVVARYLPTSSRQRLVAAIGRFT